MKVCNINRKHEQENSIESFYSQNLAMTTLIDIDIHGEYSISKIR